jgi:hypothetical protein
VLVAREQDMGAAAAGGASRVQTLGGREYLAVVMLSGTATNALDITYAADMGNRRVTTTVLRQNYRGI